MRFRILSYCAFVLVFVSCNRDKNRLIDEFQSNGMLYYLCTSAGMDERDSLAADTSARIALIRIALDTNGHSLASFISSEILLQDNQKPYYSSADVPKLCNLYLRILADKGIADTAGNFWAIPCVFCDSNGAGEGYVGEAGKHLLAFGAPAISGLISLLNDTTHLMLMGPGDRTYSAINARGYRVRDIAAFLLCQEKGLPIHACNETSLRDQEIEELKKNF